MTIVSPGTQKRDFTYIDDVVNANICAMKASIITNHKVYNVGTGKNYSMLELASLIQETPSISFIPERPAEVHETLADISETIKDLNWTPAFKLENMIKSY